MEEDTILAHLERLAEELGVQVRHEHLEGEKGFSAGGLCRIQGRPVVILDNRASAGQKARTLARALRRFDLNHVYVRPAVRQFLYEEA